MGTMWRTTLVDILPFHLDTLTPPMVFIDNYIGQVEQHFDTTITISISLSGAALKSSYQIVMCTSEFSEWNYPQICPSLMEGDARTRKLPARLSEWRVWRIIPNLNTNSE
ncbi:unnamed protein product [Allacma fusca]|uniref:Uncharacterized protein n=1 Tax=Allacma fusca TaxID=39272 RepID=A0A8J2LJI0_9HEXA|nr:unnamed protein product [Allacma fusca]